MSKIAVIGAAGFVGMELVKNLADRGHEVIAVARNNGKFLLQRYRCSIVHPSEVVKRDDVDVVINLAYPTTGSVHHYPKRNKEILGLITKLAGTRARVIHTSTLAVFGFQLEYPAVPQKISDRRDYLYVESKIELENLLLKTIQNDRLNIVRLGNVWGKGSGAWTAPLIDKLLFRFSVGVAGREGYSNATDVANTVAYLTYLTERNTISSMRFHHLAEMSSIKWDHWIEKISALMHLEPVYSDSEPPYPAGLIREILDIFKPLKPRTVYKKLVYGRFTGSLLHTCIGLFPEERFARIKQNHIPPVASRTQFSSGDETFLWVMSCTREFKSVTDPDWVPPVDPEESWRRVVEWMEEIGYYREATKQ
jgi:nucleoside-diphosphate-sugar epimerase